MTLYVLWHFDQGDEIKWPIYLHPLKHYIDEEPVCTHQSSTLSCGDLLQSGL